jgi:hypothetical protein
MNDNAYKLYLAMFSTKLSGESFPGIDKDFVETIEGLALCAISLADACASPPMVRSRADLLRAIGHLTEAK